MKIDNRPLEILIKGRVASKKNAKQLIKRYGRIIPISSKAWQRFEKEVMNQMKEMTHLRRMRPPYRITYHFYMKGSGYTDLDNMIAGINDLLEGIGIIDNDRYVLYMDAYKHLNSGEYYTEILIESVDDDPYIKKLDQEGGEKSDE